MQAARIGASLVRLFDAAAGLQDWPLALHDFARSAESVGVFVTPFEAEDLGYSLPVSSDLTESVGAYLRDGWLERDYRKQRLGSLVEQPFVIEHQLSSAETRERHPYYRYMRSHGLLWWAGMPFKIDDRLWAVTFQRGVDQKPFTLEDAAPLLALRPVLIAALTLARRLNWSAGTAQLSLLDRLSCAAVLIDWRGTVLQLNAGAERLFGAEVMVRNNRLMAAERKNDERLQALISSCRACPMGVPSISAPIPIFRIGRHPLLVQALPVIGNARDLFQRSLAVITFVEPGSAHPMHSTALRQAFGLTPSESTLAMRIASGESLGEAAAGLGVAKSTVAQRLKSIYTKTDTHRQAELVALLSPLRLLARRNA